MCRRSLFFAGMVTMLLLPLQGAGQGLLVEPLWIEGFHPLDESHQELSPLNAPKSALLQLTTHLFTDTAQIDFEKRQITFRRTDPLGYTMWEFHYGELSDYLSSRKYFAVTQSWRKSLSAMQPSGVSADKQGMKMEWELPVQYPTWAQRVLGKEPPKLTISGFLEIAMGWQYTKWVPEGQDRAIPAFNFDINYEFTITGSVGRLINLNIRASKEQNFDISENLKNFKIEYKESTPGELEDEIIQEVIVGYTGFDMPGTSLSGYSESHEGLFGIKIKAKVGPLQLTTIVSTEQGQSNKKSYSSSSGGSGGAAFKTNEYLRDRYFFLNNAYRRYYIKKYAPQGGAPAAPPKVKELSVWRLYGKRAIEMKSNIRNVRVDNLDEIVQYERLERDKHYYLDPAEGYIRFADSVTFTSEQQAAIYLRTDDAGNPEFASMQRGNIETVTVADTTRHLAVGDTVWNLWTIRPREPIQSASADTARFYLMWRNVYGQANFSDPASFKLSVKQIDQTSATERIEKKPGGDFFSTIMGLTDKDNKPKQSKVIYNTEFSDLVLPPFDTSFNGFEPFNNPALGDILDSLIYRYSDEGIKNFIGYKPLYEIEMSGTKKKTTFDDLGWGIMEGTETVKADGTKLERDIDYTIDYNMGVVDLISSRAKAAEKIDIDFQSDAMFVPDRKMFFGTNGRIDLPFISDKSYAGASLLFQSTENNDNVPRLEQEPYNKLLLDVNSHLEFEPEWMTNIVKAIPLVKTQATSNATFDVEFARSMVNPNKRGSAYVDDFEDSKQSDALSNSYTGWYLASPPTPNPSADSLWYYPPAWDMFWFSPSIEDDEHSIKRTEIMTLTEEDKKASQLGSDKESVVRLHVTPAPPVDSLLPRYKKAWAGIMAPISPSFANKQLTQFFEFFIKAEGGFSRKGTLRIQMGKMREDVSIDGGLPNKRPDNEDTSWAVQKEDYDSTLDMGWDRLKDSAEVHKIPGRLPDTWDILSYGDPLLGPDTLDPSKDNWREYFKQTANRDVKNYRYACRRSGDYTLSSEDINYDGAVQTALAEQYFQFSIDLGDSASPLIDSTVKYAQPGVWRKYRIPLHEVVKGYENMLKKIGDPNWSNITTVRLIWTDFDTLEQSEMTREKSLIFWNMEFAGNQWMEIPDSTRVKIRSSVVSTREDKDYEYYWGQYKNLINRERNEYGLEPEQSLRLNFVNLLPGDTALVKKSVQYQNLNFSAYERLTMQMFGVQPPGSAVPLSQPLYGGNVRFVFRFGTDDSTYYEYSRPILPEWNNTVDINLKELSSLKDEYMIRHRDGRVDTMEEKGNGVLWRVRAPLGRQPNFAHVQWMALGVIRNDRSGGNDSLSGEIWVDEMKLDGIRNINGTASRIDLSTKWADLLTLQGRLEYESGNFRRMTEMKNVPDASDMSASAGVSMGLEKFLPEEWGLSLSTGVNYNSSLKRPQLKNETDVYLLNKKGNPDGFFDMAKDAASLMSGITTGGELTNAEPYQTSSVGRTYFTGYKKTKHDENPIVNFLADRWTADVRYSTTIGETRYGRNAGAGGDDAVYAKRDTSDNYNGKLHYDLTPYNPPEWLKWKPFADAKPEWFPSRLKSYELTLLPRNFSIDAADVTLSKQRQVDTWRRISSSTNGYTVRHNATLSYTPLAPLCDLDYSLSINRDLIDFAGKPTKDKGRAVFRRDQNWKNYWLLLGEKERTQHTGMRLSPKFFEWLTTSADYSSDYSQRISYWQNDTTLYLDPSVKSSLSLDGSISFDQIFSEIKTATDKKAIGALFDMVKKGFDQIGLRQISCTYKAGSDLNNDYVGTDLLEDQGILGIKDLMLYQLGLKGRTPLDVLTGEMDDDAFLGMNSRNDQSDFSRGDSRKVDRSLRFSSSLAFKPLDITINNVSLSHSINYTVYPDSTRNDTTIVYPEVSVSLSTQLLDRLPMVKTNMQGVGVSSSYNYRQSDQLSSREGGSSRSQKFDFTPLVAISGTLKRWPIKLEYRHNWSQESSMALDETRTPSETNKDATMHSNEVSLNYEVERSSKFTEIKLLMWTIPIKGRTTIGCKVNHSHETEKVTDRKDKTVSLTPNLSYIFTDNVTGRIEYSHTRQDHLGRKSITNNFMLTVRISF